MVNYWLFIIPEDDYPGILWERCIEDNVLAMEYLSNYKGFTLNIKLIREMKKEDLVVAYLRNKRIGGIGEVDREYFNAEKPFEGCGDDGYRQRIGIHWIYVKDKNYPTIDYGKILGERVIGSATIHNLSKNEYNKFLNVFKIENKDNSYFERNNILNNKNQIIFFGPPGTGKTYKARELAVEFIEGIL